MKICVLLAALMLAMVLPVHNNYAMFVSDHSSYSQDCYKDKEKKKDKGKEDKTDLGKIDVKPSKERSAKSDIKSKPPSENKGKLRDFSEPYFGKRSEQKSDKPGRDNGRENDKGDGRNLWNDRDNDEHSHDRDKGDRGQSRPPRREKGNSVETHPNDDKHDIGISSHSHHDVYEIEEGDFLDDFTNDVFDGFLGGMYYFMFGDHGFRYSGRPYNHKLDPDRGVYVFSQEKQVAATHAFQLRNYYQPVNDGVRSYGTYGKILFPSSVNWDLYTNSYYERFNGRMDSLRYFSTYLNLGGLTSNTNVTFQLGLGGVVLTNVSGDQHGSPSAQVKLDCFPREPIGLHAFSNFSAPSRESLINWGVEIGWHSGVLELFIGHHALINSEGNQLNGPVVGCGLWF